MLTDTWCARGARYNNYEDLGSAISACEEDTGCFAIYDKNCNGDDFKLCRNWFIFSDSNFDSCVFPKSTATPVNLSDVFHNRTVIANYFPTLKKVDLLFVE